MLTWHDTCSNRTQPLPRVSAAAPCADEADGEVNMLWTIFVVLLLLWFLGVVSSYTLGGFIHILLVLAVIAVLVQLISGRRTTI
jgi:uncharacterized protein DUF5670